MISALENWTDAQIESILAPYGHIATPYQCSSIRVYVELLLRWNRRLSLTAVTNPSEILRFHIGETIAAIPAAGISRGRLADVGSGAGFPGIPLALFLPEIEVTLIESNNKKATFLAEVQRSLEMVNVHVFRGRFESMQPSSTKFDTVTARALGSYATLLRWSTGILTANGRIVLWLGAEDAHVISQTARWAWNSPQELPHAAKRVILVGQPLG